MQEELKEYEQIETDAQLGALEEEGEVEKDSDWTKVQLHMREDPMSVYELKRKYDRQQLVNDPDFQRHAVWKPEQKSRFIESLLLNFPIPPLYVNETLQGKWEVIDGRQRTTTLFGFMNGDFALKGLEVLKQYNDCRFQDLPMPLQTKIEDKKLSIYILSSGTPIWVVYELFDRLNTGGTPLNRQEVRHCIFRGKSTELLRELSEHEIFRRAIGEGISAVRMKDREIILRFLAFRHRDFVQLYAGDLSAFLEDTMRWLNGLEDSRLEEMKEEFIRVMGQTYAFYGEQNFRFPQTSQQRQSRGFINTCLFETVAVFFAKQSAEFIERNAQILKDNFLILLKNSDFSLASRYSTGSKSAVLKRFQLSEQILKQDTQ